MNKQTSKAIKKFWKNNDMGITYSEYIKNAEKIEKSWRVLVFDEGEE